MSKELVKIDGIYDVYPLAYPALSNLESGVLIFILAILISTIGFLLWFYFYSPKNIIKRQIKQLHTSYINNNINNHETIYQACGLLRQAFKINHIGEQTVLPNKIKQHKNRWQEFSKQVSVLRYQKHKENVSDLNNFFEECLFWLKVW